MTCSLAKKAGPSPEPDSAGGEVRGTKEAVPAPKDTDQNTRSQVGRTLRE